MCLTLTNAATIHHHTDPTGTAVRGYTSTTHHAGYLTPGDQWRPLPDQPPRTVTDIHRRHGVDHRERRHPMTTNAGHSARPAPITGHHARPPPVADENPDVAPMTPPDPGPGSPLH